MQVQEDYWGCKRRHKRITGGVREGTRGLLGVQEKAQEDYWGCKRRHRGACTIIFL